ncbi:hypothetical protein F0562_013848 [Nyssa sinensis]|uniref:EF-hand domain-containing protein n=1 Tax=Nyssa sinensis TaxID=561372 RepID=A0A5J4ZRC2_9ASTE|nr:hypothetical protein F0562_013848 [Nyssa sinensis]
MSFKKAQGAILFSFSAFPILTISAPGKRNIMKIIRATSVFFLLLLMTHLGYSRLARENLSLISDGVDNQARQSSIIEPNLGESTVTCTPIYSFLPCTTDPVGQLLLILLYEYLLYVGDKYVSAGSELFFQTFGPGLFGASLFHILGTIPMVVMTLASGLSVSRESAGEQATMGMSILAGSVVMLLTLLWGLCVAFGCFDLSEASNSPKNEHAKPFCLTGFGVRTDDLPEASNSPKNEHAKPFSLTGFGVRTDDDTSNTAIVMILSMVSWPWIQNRRFEYLLSKFVKDKLLVLLTSHGRPNIQFIRQIFCKIDKDGSGKISKEELRVLILGIQLQDYFGLDEGEVLQKVIEIFDTSGDDHIDKDEFERGLLKYICDKNENFVIKDHHQKAKEEEWRVVSKGGAQKSWRNYFKATVQVLLGTIILLLLGSPLTGTVTDFACAVNLSSFYVTYFVIPLALNMRMALSLINSARQKTQNAISLSFSEIYSSVFMNNMMSLLTFLALVYIRNLPWDV